MYCVCMYVCMQRNLHSKISRYLVLYVLCMHLCMIMTILFCHVCMYCMYVCMYGSESACVAFELRGCDKGRASAAAGDEGPRGQLRRRGAMQ